MATVVGFVDERKDVDIIMNDNNSSAAKGGVSFLGLLTILFIGLKLTGYIDWDWWWVLAPLWIPIALVVAGGIIYILVYVLLHLVRNR